MESERCVTLTYRICEPSVGCVDVGCHGESEEKLWIWRSSERAYLRRDEAKLPQPRQPLLHRGALTADGGALTGRTVEGDGRA